MLHSYSTTLNYSDKIVEFSDITSEVFVVLLANSVIVPVEISRAIVSLAFLVNNDIFENFQK